MGRAASIANDIATASIELPAVDGDAAKTAIVLASIASFESAFAARVDACIVHGGSARVRAWSLWQIQGARAELCPSRIEAARLALRMIATSVDACRGEPLAVYTTGTCRRDEKAKWRWLRAIRWSLAHELDDVADLDRGA